MSQHRNKREAERSFVDDIQRSLSRFHGRAQWCLTYGDGDCRVRTIPGLIPVPCESRSVLYLALVIVFHAERDEDGRAWQVVVDKYSYALCLNDDLNAEIVAWHWHPKMDSRSLPHIHVQWKEGPIDDFGRVHFPTSQVTFEQVLLFLMQDRRIKAIPAASDAAEYLEQKDARLGKGLVWLPRWSETE